MEIRQYIALFLRWSWLIVLGVLFAGTAAFFVSRSQDPVYKATSVLLITEGTLNTNNEFSALQYSERLAQSYVQRLTNHEVLSQSILNLGLPLDPTDLKESIQVSLLNNSQLIALSVENTDPQVATALANEIPAVFAERNSTTQLERYASSRQNLEAELNDVQLELTQAQSALAAAQAQDAPQTTLDQLTNNVLQLRDTHTRLLEGYENIRVAEASSLNNITIDERALVPQNPIRPRTLTNTLLAAIVGGMIAVGIVFLIEYLDDTVKDPEVIEQTLGVGVLGFISQTPNGAANDELLMLAQPRSPNAEAYRQVRTNIQYVGISREVKTLLITSANAGEGKSTTAANLAVSLAQAGDQVILVDTDLRRPTLHRYFQTANNHGLTNLLLDKEGNLETFLRPTAIPNLQLVPSGPLPPYPAELLGSERMRQIIAQLSAAADYVIFDSPPILAVTDSVLLSQLSSATLLVVETGKTRTQALLQAIKQIVAVDGHIAGIVLNKVQRRRGSYYYYNYSNANYYAESQKKKTYRLRQIVTGFFTL